MVFNRGIEKVSSDYSSAYSSREHVAKVMVLYKDPQLQERWISEIIAATPFSREIVERVLSDKNHDGNRSENDIVQTAWKHED